MPHRFLVLACATLAAAAAGAQSAPRVLPYPIDLPADFQQAIERGSRTPTGRPGPSYWTNRAHYAITAELDPVTARVTGRAVMTYSNRSPEPLRELRIHLRQNLHKAGAMRTRVVEVTDGVELTEVAIDGRPLSRLPRVSDTRLRLRLPEPVPAGGQIEVAIGWTFPVPQAGRAPRNGHEGEDVFYLAYWYPQFAVFDDVEGWVQDLYQGNGEFYMGYADYDVSFTAPVGYLVRMTGELQNPGDVLTERARQALVRARESHDVVQVVSKEDLDAGGLTSSAASGKLEWRYRAENVRDCAVSVARTYVWDATHALVPGPDGAGERHVMIHTVYEPGSGAWDRAAAAAQHTIEYMSRAVYPYPWPHMTACEGIIGGGMEFPMMTIIGSRGSSGTIAHELVHMWFPMLVGSNEKRHAWQDEGFTSFFTSLVTADHAEQTGAPRRSGLSPAQGAALAYVRSIRSGDVVCMTHADAFVNSNHGLASYTKPAAVLHQLRGMLGEETFDAAFRRYAREWAFKHPYPYDFFHTFSDAAGVDLDWYFRTWLYESWTLDQAVAAVVRADGRSVVTIEDRGRALHPTVVEATLAGGEKVRQYVPWGHWQTARSKELSFAGEVERVVVDPDGVTLDVDRDNNEWPR